jgi:peptidoglycan/xylan/chitin deacetylase (PgdA/CDA1 family)
MPSSSDAPGGHAGASSPARGGGPFAAERAGNNAFAWRSFPSDTLGETAVYRAHWGSRFDFMYPYTNDCKRWVGNLAQKTLYWSGIAEIYNRARHHRGATIQMYHSVSKPEEQRWIDPRFTITPDEFESQMRFLGRHRNVVPYTALTELLERGEEPPAGTVAITFDDGYLDTLRVAAPIMEKYGLPAIAFLVTGYVDRGQTQWSDELFSLFVSHTRNFVKIPEISPSTVDLGDELAKAAAYAALQLWFITALPAERAEMLALLADEFRPECVPPRLTMTWDDVREMVREHPSIEIGLHSAEHLDLTAHDGALAQSELDQCLQATYRELGVRPKHFAFPYNRVSPEARELVLQSGFRSAVATGNGIVISSKSDRLALPRMETCRSLTLFRFRTGGACPGVSRSLLRYP